MSRPHLLIAANSDVVRLAAHTAAEYIIRTNALPHRLRSMKYRVPQDVEERLLQTESEDALVLLDLTNEINVSDAFDIGERFLGMGTAAQLVLRFPEVQWAFLVRVPRAKRAMKFMTTGDASPADENERNTEAHHVVHLDSFEDDLTGVLRRHTDGYRSLFDPTGLRSTLKGECARLLPSDSAGKYLPVIENRRTKKAVSIDEERTFLYLNGYVAYRKGYGTWVCRCARETVRVLNITDEMEKAKVADEFRSPTDFVPVAVLSDYQLQFPDITLCTSAKVKRDGKETTDSSAAMRAIAQKIAKKASPETRVIFITSHPTDARENLRIPENANIKFEEKPSAGIVYLAATLPEIKPPQPNNLSASIRVPTITHHSAPYAVAAIATRLLDRSRSILSRSQGSVDGCVVAAVLALEAKEMLSGLARTIFLEACAYQQEAEVAAESSFFGVARRLEVNTRLAEVEKEIWNVLNAGDSEYAKNNAKAAKNNAMLQIASNLRVRLMEREQFEAAEVCLEHVHRFDAKLEWGQLRQQWTKRQSGEGPRPHINGGTEHAYRILRACGKSYINLVSSGGTNVWRFFLASAVWIVLFAIVLSPHRGWGIVESFQHAFLTFVTLQPGTLYEDLTWWGRGVTLVELVVAVVHLGLLISMLHRKVVRASG